MRYAELSRIRHTAACQRQRLLVELARAGHRTSTHVHRNCPRCMADRERCPVCEDFPQPRARDHCTWRLGQLNLTFHDLHITGEDVEWKE